jgi:hypothetical protein
MSAETVTGPIVVASVAPVKATSSPAAESVPPSISKDVVYVVAPAVPTTVKSAS